MSAKGKSVVISLDDLLAEKTNAQGACNTSRDAVKGNSFAPPKSHEHVFVMSQLLASIHVFILFVCYLL